MATALMTGAFLMNEEMESEEKQLRPELKAIVEDLIALRAMQRDGITTIFSQQQLVKHLNPRDTADVAKAVRDEEKRLRTPIYVRKPAQK